MFNKIIKNISIIISLLFIAGIISFVNVRALADGFTVNKLKFEVVKENLPENITSNSEWIKGERGYIIFDGADFKTPENNYYVLICSGQRSTGGYGIAVTSVEDNEGKTVITVQESAPVPGEIVNMMITHPTVVIRISKIGMAPNFVVNTSTGERISPIRLNLDGTTNNGITTNKINFEMVSPDKYPKGLIENIGMNSGKRGYYAYEEKIPKTGKSECYVFITLGMKTTGGYSVNPVSVEDVEGKTVIVADEVSPKPDAMVTQAITYPGTVIRILDSIAPNFEVKNTNGEKFDVLKSLANGNSTAVENNDITNKGYILGNGIVKKIKGSMLVISMNKKLYTFEVPGNIVKSSKFKNLKVNRNITFKYINSKNKLKIVQIIK